MLIKILLKLVGTDWLSAAITRGMSQSSLDLLLQRASALAKDHFVSRAEVLELLKPSVLSMTQLRAAAMTEGLKFTCLTFRVSDGFLRGKIVSGLAPGYFGPRIHVNVPQLPTILDEEVARIDVAIVLDHNIAVAPLMHGAGAGL